MRTTLFISLIMILSSLSSLTHAQRSGGGLTYGGYYNFRVYANDLLSGFNGFGAKVGYASSKLIYGGEIGYGFFPDTKYSSTATTQTSTNTTSTLEYETTVSASAFDVKGYGKYYFTGEPRDGGFYGTVKVHFSFLSLEATHDVTEQERKAYDVPEDNTENLFQPFIDLGVGYGLEIGPGKAYLELIGGLPANEVNGERVAISIPPYFGPMLGYRF